MYNQLQKKSKQLVLLSINKLYVLFFGRDMEKEVINFSKKLIYSVFGGGIYAVIMMVVTIIAGREMGPKDFGRYNFFIYIVNVLVIFLILGLDTSSVYHVSEAGAWKKKKSYITTSFCLYVVFLILFSPIIYIFFRFYSFGVYPTLIPLLAVFAIFLSMKNVYNAYLKGIHDFKGQAFVNICEAIMISLLFILLVCFGKVNYLSYVYIFLLGYLLIDMILFFRLYKFFGKFDKNLIKKLLVYGLITIVGSLNGILLNNIDKFSVRYFLGEFDLGVYTAYYSSSIIVVSQLGIMVVNVVFPVLSAKKSGKSAVISKINRFFILSAIPGILLLLLITWVMLKFFGPEYEIVKSRLLLLSFLGYITFYVTILWWFIASLGKKGIKFTSINGVISGLIFITFILVFKPFFSINLLIVFLIIANLYSVLIGNYYIKCQTKII